MIAHTCHVDQNKKNKQEKEKPISHRSKHHTPLTTAMSTPLAHPIHRSDGVSRNFYRLLLVPCFLLPDNIHFGRVIGTCLSDSDALASLLRSLCAK